MLYPFADAEERAEHRCEGERRDEREGATALRHGESRGEVGGVPAERDWSQQRRTRATGNGGTWAAHTRAEKAEDGLRNGLEKSGRPVVEAEGESVRVMTMTGDEPC